MIYKDDGRYFTQEAYYQLERHRKMAKEGDYSFVGAGNSAKMYKVIGRVSSGLDISDTIFAMSESDAYNHAMDVFEDKVFSWGNCEGLLESITTIEVTRCY